MDNIDDNEGFKALAHDTYNAVVRLLVPAGPDGLAAGDSMAMSVKQKIQALNDA